MRRYLILAGSHYYPTGWSDFAGFLDTITECLRRTNDIQDQWLWTEIIDMNTHKIVVRQNKSWKQPGDKHYRVITSFII